VFDVVQVDFDNIPEGGEMNTPTLQVSTCCLFLQTCNMFADLFIVLRYQLMY